MSDATGTEGQNGTEGAAPEGTAPVEGQQPPAAPPQGERSLEDLIADAKLDESVAKGLLDAARKPRNEAKNLRDRLRDAEGKATKYDDYVKSQQTEAERATTERDEAIKRAEALQARLAQAEIGRLAADKFVDTSDVITALKVSELVNESGDVDDKAVTAALAELAERKPHWLKTTGTKAPFNKAQGSSSAGVSSVQQLTQDDLKSMTPEQIVKAEADGQLADLTKRAR